MDALQKRNQIEIERLEQLLVDAYAAASRRKTEHDVELVKLMTKQSSLQTDLNVALVSANDAIQAKEVAEELADTEEKLRVQAETQASQAQAAAMAFMQARLIAEN